MVTLGDVFDDDSDPREAQVTKHASSKHEYDSAHNDTLLAAQHAGAILSSSDPLAFPHLSIEDRDRRSSLRLLLARMYLTHCGVLQNLISGVDVTSRGKFEQKNVREERRSKRIQYYEKMHQLASNANRLARKENFRELEVRSEFWLDRSCGGGDDDKTVPKASSSVQQPSPPMPGTTPPTSKPPQTTSQATQTIIWADQPVPFKTAQDIAEEAAAGTTSKPLTRRTSTFRRKPSLARRKTGDPEASALRRRSTLARRNTRASRKPGEPDRSPSRRRPTYGRRNTRASSKSAWPSGSDGTSSDSSPKGRVLADELEGLEDEWEEYDSGEQEGKEDWMEEEGGGLSAVVEHIEDDAMIKVVNELPEEVRRMKESTEKDGGMEKEPEQLDEEVKNEAMERVRRFRESREIDGREGVSK